MKIEWAGPVTKFGALTITVAQFRRMSAAHDLPVPWSASIDCDQYAAPLATTDHATEAEAREWAERFVERISSGAVARALAERPKELSARAVLDLIEKRVEEMREGQREVLKTSDERTVIICASGAFEALTKLRLCLDELRGRGDV